MIEVQDMNGPVICLICSMNERTLGGLRQQRRKRATVPVLVNTKTLEATRRILIEDQLIISVEATTDLASRMNGRSVLGHKCHFIPFLLGLIPLVALQDVFGGGAEYAALSSMVNLNTFMNAV